MLPTDTFADLSIDEKREMLTDFIMQNYGGQPLLSGTFNDTFIEQSNESLMIMIYDILINCQSTHQKVEYITMLTNINKKGLIEITNAYMGLRKNKIKVDIINDTNKNSQEADDLLIRL